MAQVKFFATLRDITGKREMEIKNVKNVAELLQHLYEMFGDEFRKEIEERNMILVNGKNILDLDGYETKIKEKDEISIFPPAGGG